MFSHLQPLPKQRYTNGIPHSHYTFIVVIYYSETENYSLNGVKLY